MTKNPDINRYKHSGYGIGFDRHGSYSYPSGRTGRNVIIFAVDMSSSMKIDNRKKDILILEKAQHKDWNIHRAQKILIILQSAIKSYV